MSKTNEYFRIKSELAQEFEMVVNNAVKYIEAIKDHAFAKEINMTKNVSIQDYVKFCILNEVKEIHEESLLVVAKLNPELVEGEINA